MNKRSLLVVLSACFIAGCELAPIEEYGDFCPPATSRDSDLSYILLPSGAKCTQDSSDAKCTDFAYNFDMKTCPKEIERCYMSGEDTFYCRQACSGNQISCNGECVNPLNEREFCGAKGFCFSPDANDENYVGKKCAENEACIDGVCSPTNIVECNPSDVTCDGSCIDPQGDERFCGAKGQCTSTDANSEDFRGVACQPYSECQNGTCVCAFGYVDCNGICVNSLNDHDHCGGCGKACSDNQVCLNGKCQIKDCGEKARCQVGEDFYCFDLTNDAEHCGVCQNSCESNKPQRELKTLGCVSGQCKYACADGMTNCSVDGYECLSDSDLKRSKEHCGFCGNACGVGRTCKNGNCVNTTCGETQCDVGGNCVTSNEQCGPSCKDCTKVSDAKFAYCDGGMGECKVMACNAGYHISVDGRQCEVTEDKACASTESDSPKNCTVAYENGTGVCDVAAGECILASCNDGAYRVGNDKCIVCNANEHFYAETGSCELDSSENCGAHGNACGVDGRCIDKVCYYSDSVCASYEGERCYTESGGVGICRGAGSGLEASYRKCAAEGSFDKTCFKDGTHTVTCENKSGSDKKCIYSPGDTHTRQDWTCGCLDEGNTFCLVREKNSSGVYENHYKCVLESKCFI